MAKRTAAAAAARGEMKEQQLINKCCCTIQMLRLTQDDIIRFDSIRCLNCWSLTFFNRRARVYRVHSIHYIHKMCIHFDIRYSTACIGAWDDDDLWSFAKQKIVQATEQTWHSAITSSVCSFIRRRRPPNLSEHSLNSCAFCIFQCVSHTRTCTHNLSFNIFLELFSYMRADVCMCVCVCSLLTSP